MKKLMSKKKGFTLVELLVVVAIIAILMLLALPKFLDSTKGAKIRTFEGNVRTVMSQIVQYSANNNGGYDNIATATSDVKKFADSIKDKPAGAKYDVTADKLTATLDKEKTGFTNDYVLEYTYNTGAVVMKTAPETNFKSGLVNGATTGTSASGTPASGTTGP